MLTNDRVLIKEVNEPGVSYDFIGDVHGCSRELMNLLFKLGYDIRTPEDCPSYFAHKTANRKAVFLGDMCDRGPNSISVYNIVKGMVENLTGHAILGNHDEKFGRYLAGRDVKINHGLETTVESYREFQECFNAYPDGLYWGNFYQEFIASLPYAIKFTPLNVIAVHGAYNDTAGKGQFIRYAMYGETDGKTKDDRGYLIRLDNWKYAYEGDCDIIVGHEVVKEPTEVISKSGKRVIDIDLGCSTGGKLCALRYPEMEYVTVDSDVNWKHADKYED